MSKIESEHVFTSESVSEGHPDKVCDQISDAILDACLDGDPESRVACETLATTDMVVISGEITTASTVNWQQTALDVIKRIGYTEPKLGFSVENCKVMVCLHKQSQDISQGVTPGLSREQGAGDQGMMYGYATDETPELMPPSILYAHRIMQELATLRKSDPGRYGFLKPDAKSQVSIHYKNGRPQHVEAVVVSHQHSADMEIGTLSSLVHQVVHKVIPAALLDEDIKYYINPTGKFVLGGPHADTGLTGRKIIVDTYGGVGSHGGGAFSGKDPSKVDRSAAYMCRYIAKNIVASGLAEKCELQVAYAIGVAEPLSINVTTYGTGKLRDDAMLEKVVRQVFDLRPAAILTALDLKHPKKNGWSYFETASYGHFGRLQFPWEKTDRTGEVLAAAKPFMK